MDIMTIFDLILAVFGIYMVISGRNMSKHGEISTMLITSEEITRCRNKQGFIDYMYRKEVMFGALFIIIGGIGLINTYFISYKVFDIIQLILLVATFLWFEKELGKARQQFI